MNSPEYILLGQGLAGTCLGLSLRQRGIRFRVIDAPVLGRASAVSAGMFSPVTGKRLALTWRWDELFPVAETFYRGLEAQLGASFFHRDQPVIRIFDTEEERVAWEIRSKQAAFHAVSEFGVPRLPKGVDAGCGSVQWKQSGWMDLPRFLAAARELFREEGCLEERVVDLEGLKTVADIEAGFELGESSKLIFCLGALGASLPCFSFFPWRLAQGDVLVARGRKGPELNVILSRGGISMRQLDGEADLYRIGASYKTVAPGVACRPEPELAPELLARAQRLAHFEAIEASSQEAGLRPNSTHFRPVLGMHPEHSSIGLFNSLGSKGVMYAPFFARQFVEHIAEGRELDREVDVLTYFKKYAGEKR